MGGWAGDGQRHKLVAYDIGVAWAWVDVGLPRSEQAIVVSVLNRGAEDHYAPVHAAATRARRHDGSCHRRSAELHCRIDGRVIPGPGRIVPGAVINPGERHGRVGWVETGKGHAVQHHTFGLIRLAIAHDVGELGYRCC